MQDKNQIQKKIAESMNINNKNKSEKQQEKIQEFAGNFVIINSRANVKKYETQSYNKDLEEDHKYFQELDKLNTKLHHEHTERTKKINDYKRNQILEKDLKIKEKNKQTKNAFQLYNCHMRKQALISKTTGKSLILELFNKIKKADTNTKEHRTQLMETFNSLNSRYNLGLTLSTPPSKQNEKTD